MIFRVEEFNRYDIRIGKIGIIRPAIDLIIERGNWYETSNNNMAFIDYIERENIIVKSFNEDNIQTLKLTVEQFIAILGYNPTKITKSIFTKERCLVVRKYNDQDIKTANIINIGTKISFDVYDKITNTTSNITGVIKYIEREVLFLIKIQLSRSTYKEIFIYEDGTLWSEDGNQSKQIKKMQVCSNN